MSEVAQKIVFNRGFRRTVGEPRQLLTQEEAKKFKTMADTIRGCKKKFPDATYGEIARFLSQGAKQGEEGFVRPQWVYNVINNPPKTK